MRIIIILVSLAALLLALSAAAAGPGGWFGFWDYGDGLGWLRKLSMPALIAAGLAFLAFIASLVTRRWGLAMLALVASAAAATAGYTPMKMRELARAHPFIHDITTDFDNPPPIITAADLPRRNPPHYVGDEQAPRSELTVAEAQRAAFPDIGPKFIEVDVEEASSAAQSVLNGMGMEILATHEMESGVLIEAVATSRWFRFKDDFIVRIAPEDVGVRIDARSKSRVGGSDLGVNGRRIQKFFVRLEAAL